MERPHIFSALLRSCTVSSGDTEKNKQRSIWWCPTEIYRSVFETSLIRMFAHSGQLPWANAIHVFLLQLPYQPAPTLTHTHGRKRTHSNYDLKRKMDFSLMFLTNGPKIDTVILDSSASSWDGSQEFAFFATFASLTTSWSAMRGERERERIAGREFDRMSGV